MEEEEEEEEEEEIVTATGGEVVAVEAAAMPIKARARVIRATRMAQVTMYKSLVLVLSLISDTHPKITIETDHPRAAL